jgi:hypothetical protein
MAEEKQQPIHAAPVNEPLKPSTISEAPMPAHKVPDIALKFGEVLIAPILDGKEGDPFKVSINTYRQYYADETKFVVKKKFQ